MMYSEFIEGTGCKENAHNYKVFCDLEVMYMHSNLTKSDIYEYGKKLVDNSKSKEELEFEKKVKDEIENHKEDIAKYKECIERNVEMMNYCKEQNDKEMVAFYRNTIKCWKEEIRYHRNQITSLKWVLEG